jgi:hypothetical protein
LRLIARRHLQRLLQYADLTRIAGAGCIEARHAARDHDVRAGPCGCIVEIRIDYASGRAIADPNAANAVIAIAREAIAGRRNDRLVARTVTALVVVAAVGRGLDDRCIGASIDLDARVLDRLDRLIDRRIGLIDRSILLIDLHRIALFLFDGAVAILTAAVRRLLIDRAVIGRQLRALAIFIALRVALTEAAIGRTGL